MSVGAQERLVLASASAVRRRLLDAAGIAVLVDPAAIDEAAIKDLFHRAGQPIDDCAMALAEAKALAVAARHPGVLVIGADQMLSCAGRWLDKPRDPDEARRQLAWLRGQTHELHTAVAVARDGNIVGRHGEQARLAMRAFSDDFLAAYVAAMGQAICDGVGGYALEGLGAQLFGRIEGDYFTILGLPLLPLLGMLRRLGALAA
jgi:septum formation protein